MWRVFFATDRSGTQTNSTAYFLPGRRTIAIDAERTFPDAAFRTAATPAPGA
jgi:hypothetical protein